MSATLLPSRRFDVVDIGAVARPAALEEWTYRAILDARKAAWLGYWGAAREADPTLPQYDAQSLESDPAIIIQRVDALRETLVRQRVNEAVLATFLLFAVGADLDARAAEYNTIRAAGESDASLRLRAILAWENLSIGGSYGGYEYQARSVAPVDILDVAVYGHEVQGVARGEVRIVVLGNTPRGATAPSVLDRVRQRFAGRDARKVNDFVVVSAAAIRAYEVDATLVLGRGADPDVVRGAQYAATAKYAAARKRIGASVTPSGLLDAIGHDDPNVVQSVEMRAPFSGQVDLSNPPRIGGGAFEAPVCTGIRLDWRFAA